MKQLFFLSLLALFFKVQAQDLDTIKINNNGTLIIEVDSRLNKAITEHSKCSTKSQIATNKILPAIKKGSISDPCLNQTQISGYKIQIYYSKNRDQAQEIKTEFDNSFPNFSSQITYYRPDYRVLVGDYFTKKSATSDLRKIKTKYNSSFTIPFKVQCRKAK